MHDRVSFDINPSSRHILQTLADKGYLSELIAAGARTHQPGCNGCRSGTREDSVYLCSPETAAASALKGVITDPRDLGMSYERIKEPESFSTSIVMFVSPEVKNDISTDDIIPAGARVLPYWSNIPKVSEFTFEEVDNKYVKRASESRDRKDRKGRDDHLAPHSLETADRRSHGGWRNQLAQTL